MERYHKAMSELRLAALVAEKGLDLIHWNTGDVWRSLSKDAGDRLDGTYTMQQLLEI